MAHTLIEELAHHLLCCVHLHGFGHAGHAALARLARRRLVRRLHLTLIFVLVAHLLLYPRPQRALRRKCLKVVPRAVLVLVPLELDAALVSIAHVSLHRLE